MFFLLGHTCDQLWPINFSSCDPKNHHFERWCVWSRWILVPIYSYSLLRLQEDCPTRFDSKMVYPFLSSLFVSLVLLLIDTTYCTSKTDCLLHLCSRFHPCQMVHVYSVEGLGANRLWLTISRSLTVPRLDESVAIPDLIGEKDGSCVGWSERPMVGYTHIHGLQHGKGKLPVGQMPDTIGRVSKPGWYVGLVTCSPSRLRFSEQFV